MPLPESLPVALACDMAAIPFAEREEHQRVTRDLFSSVTDIAETPEGFTLQFSADHYDTIVRFMGWERLCCPFLRFTLEVTPAAGPVWLRVTGPAGSAAFIRAELHLP